MSHEDDRKPKVTKAKMCECGCKIHNKRKPRDPNKAKRPLSDYNKFVKEHYPTVKDKPVKERLKLISEMWKAKKKKQVSK